MKSKANLTVVNTENQGEVRLDWLKWSVAIALLLAVLVGNHYYSAVSMPIRILVWLVFFALSGFLASKTKKGKWVLEFFRDSKAELRKVVWPTREEVTQMTFIVIAMVIVLALFLWGMDGVLVWLIGWVTGQRG